MDPRTRFIALGAAFAGLGVAAGAFGAHALADSVTPERLDTFDTAVRYHLIHALGLILVGILAGDTMPASLNRVGWAFVAGIVLFSGSLYALVLSGQTWLGAITPLGGVCFIAGWLMLASAAISRRRPPRTGA